MDRTDMLTALLVVKWPKGIKPRQYSEVVHALEAMGQLLAPAPPPLPIEVADDLPEDQRRQPHVKKRRDAADKRARLEAFLSQHQGEWIKASTAADASGYNRTSAVVVMRDDLKAERRGKGRNAEWRVP
jgi:hypothetical protein